MIYVAFSTLAAIAVGIYAACHLIFYIFSKF